ncbi:hypothetical protein V8C86DRAFT_2873510 [Haematococcus lacustris]
MPYQLADQAALPETDTAADAQLYQLPVQEGDIIIVASDGLWDNLWDEQVAAMASKYDITRPGTLTRSPAALAQALAQELAAKAHKVARDPNVRSPWAVEAAASAPDTNMLQRMFPRGGKMDDVGVAVAFVTRV